MQILYLEAFFGGSHRAFAEGLQRHSRHAIELITLPDRFWKWRMRGAALYMAPRLPPLERFDLIMATNLVSMSDLRALLAPRHLPTVVYFHENQLTYPVASGDRRDVHFGFTDITTALTADEIWFNSHSHREAFMAAVIQSGRASGICRTKAGRAARKASRWLCELNQISSAASAVVMSVKPK